MQKLHIHNPSRKFWIITASVIVAVMIVAGGAYWLLQSVESSATAGVDKTKADVGSSLQTLNTKLVNKEITSKDRLGAFSEYSQTLTKLNGDLCRTDSKNIMFAISKADDKCNAAHEKLLAVIVVGEKLEQSVKDDQSLTEAFKALKDVDPTDAAKQLAAWSAFASGLPSIAVSNDSVPVKNQLLAVAVAHRTALQELVDADKAQNKINYNAAVAKLDAAHTELAKVTDLQTVMFKKLVVQLSDSIKTFKALK